MPLSAAGLPKADFCAQLPSRLDEIQVLLSTLGPAVHTTVGLQVFIGGWRHCFLSLSRRHLLRGCAYLPQVASRSAILTVDLLGKEKRQQLGQ